MPPRSPERRPEQDDALPARGASACLSLVQTVDGPLWCMKRPAAASAHPVERQSIRTEAGMPKLVIRLSTLHPIFASVRCWGRLRA